MRRKLEQFEYSCPSCTGELVVVGIDFNYDDIESRCKSTYECIACKERFYHVEEPHITPENKAAKYRCQYCGKQCANLGLANDWTDYWKCVPCKVSYESGYVPGRPDLQTINMYTTINGHLYVMRQFMHRIKTRIEMLPDDVDDTVVIAHEFPFLLPSVNPANIQNKLLTYLIFS